MKRSKNILYHDKIAPIYDEIYESSVYWIYNRKITWHYLKSILNNLDKKAKILDLGCGSGYWGFKLIKSGFDVYFADISQQMINEVREKAENLNIDLSGKTFAIEAEKIDSIFEKEFFNLIIAYGDILSFTANPFNLLKIIRRLLVDGGIFIGTADNFFSAIEFYLKKGDESELKDFLSTGVTFWLSKNKNFNFRIKTFTYDELMKLFKKTNFEVIRFYSKPLIPLKNYIDNFSEDFILNGLLKMEIKLQMQNQNIGIGNHFEFFLKKV